MTLGKARRMLLIEFPIVFWTEVWLLGKILRAW